MEKGHHWFVQKNKQDYNKNMPQRQDYINNFSFFMYLLWFENNREMVDSFDKKAKDHFDFNTRTYYFQFYGLLPSDQVYYFILDDKY